MIKSGKVPDSLVRATRFFEFVRGIAQSATEGTMVWVPPALLQPIVSDDAAAGLAVSGPLNGTVELVGAEPTRMDDLVRRFLATNRDAREGAAEAAAVLRYGGERRSLTSGDSPCLGSTRVGD